MGCVPCGAKKQAADQQYTWTGVDAKTGATVSIVYPSLAAAKTKVRRVGGTYAKTAQASGV